MHQYLFSFTDNQAIVVLSKQILKQLKQQLQLSIADEGFSSLFIEGP